MNDVIDLRTAVSRLLPQSEARPKLGTCEVCGGPVREGEPALRLRGVRVHNRCASYRSRRRSPG